MCTENQLHKITCAVARCAKDVFGEALNSVLLYGSYARGDEDSESDIDMMILVNIPAEKLTGYKRIFTHLTSELGLENDVVITVTLKDSETFNKYRDAVPFYGNVDREGIRIAV